jgi:hypothetical protein
MLQNLIERQRQDIAQMRKKILLLSDKSENLSKTDLPDNLRYAKQVNGDISAMRLKLSAMMDYLRNLEAQVEIYEANPETFLPVY